MRLTLSLVSANNDKFRLPKKVTALVRQLHDGTRATHVSNGDTSESFPDTNGVKQGCGLATILFSMVSTALRYLYDASQKNDDDILIHIQDTRRCVQTQTPRGKHKGQGRHTDSTPNTIC